MKSFQKASLIPAIAILFLLSFFLFQAQAQTTAKKPIKQCNALLARQIVEQQADFSKTLGETDQRVNVLIKVADFLWITDEDSARDYFTQAFQVAQERYREKGFEKKENKGLTISQPDYRFKVVSAIAKRDSAWAKKLSEQILKEFDEDKEKDKRDAFNKDREIQELLYVAVEAAKDNPNLTLALARRVMRYPLTYNWYDALYSIAQTNQPLADQIYSEVLANYQNAEVFRLLYLSAYPFGRERIFGIEKYSVGANLPTDFSPNTNLQRQFLTVLLRRVMTLTPENTGKSLQTSTPEIAVAVIAMNEIEPIIAEQFPDFAQAFSQAKISAASLASNEMMNAANKRDESGKDFDKSFAERLRELEKAESEGKITDSQIVGVITSAKKEEDYKAAERWLDKIADDTPRESARNYFYFKRSKIANKENRFDEARKFAEKISKPEIRAVVYFDIAEAKQKNPMTKADSLDALLEVYKMAQKSPDSIEKAQVLLGLAYMYEKVDHSNALDALSAAIKTANKLENPNLFTSSSFQQIITKELSFYAVFDVPGFDLNKTFYEISQNDFQGATAQAESFNDKYLRTLAVLAAVKDCEKNEEKIKPKTQVKTNETKPKSN